MSEKVLLSDVFAAVDAKDAEAFMSFLSDDAVFRYGSQEPVSGRAAIRGLVEGFFGSMRSMSHRLDDTWERDDAVVCQGEVTYVPMGGGDVTLPFVNIFRLDGGLIRDYLIYVDPTPLTAGDR
jgi:ketosteroid isomerase-like protein